MSRILESIGSTVHTVIHRAHDNAHDLAQVTKSFAEENLLDARYVDLTIQFIGASGLPKVDVVGSADPYFVAKIDDRISFVSAVKVNTLSPVWNALWRIRNVPAHATLSVEVMDKDDGAKVDDFIGKFSTTISSGAKEVEIVGPVYRRAGGSFWLKIESVKAGDDPQLFPYLFDGPIRFSRHFSPTIGLLTNTTLSDDSKSRLYSTWKMYIRGIRLFFGDTVQQWNHGYKAAQAIFNPGPSSLAVRSGIIAGHRLLYARATTNQFGTIESAADVLGVLHSDGRVKPAVYTYIISAEDESLRFSETGAAFFVDFASKHALHANCHPCVRYSGEFHPRPAGGWKAFSDAQADGDVAWEIVVDNNSGTYSPDKTLLPQLKALLEYNFPGLTVHALDREDPELIASREACRAYALEHRGVKRSELQPQTHGEESTDTLAAQAMAVSAEEQASIQCEPA
ncbi:unnamed protein product [Mycena citricolor]|uniref:C2 domain-containing protein n=1 Tax=Mycena citricolor TaxID=2018698 RepID=A0AAD2HQQ2_9AGAR|nr:unnamed protein product [Mycena citricolor]